MDKIAAGQRCSFIYSGCYTALGGLTLAQKARWGLFTQAEPSRFQATQRGKISSPVLAGSQLPFPACDVELKRAMRAPGTQGTKHCSHRQQKQALAFEKSAKPRWRLHPKKFKTHSIKSFVAYRRFSVKVNGQFVSCTVFRGRPYLSACQRLAQTT
jgi:hypothetical protein